MCDNCTLAHACYSLVVQFGGVAGTLASLDPNDTGPRVRKQLATELGLLDPSHNMARSLQQRCQTYL